MTVVSSATVNPTRHRVTLTVLGVALAVIIAGAVLLMPSGRSSSLPGAVESYSPTDGAIVLRQTDLVIDLEPGYEIELTVDGTTIPTDQIDVTEPTGVFTWRPDEGRLYEEWAPGFHAVEVTWDRVTGLPDPGSLRWTFRVQ